MVKFCVSCNNRLEINIQNEELSFKCQLCNRIYPAEASDTLQYSYSKTNNLDLYERYLLNAERDPTNIRANNNCPKCKYHICKQVEIPFDLKLFNICEKCSHKWLY